MINFSLEKKIKVMPKKILFAPSSGYGHIIPCLAAADSLKSRGFEVSFLVGPSEEIDLNIITKKKYKLFVAPKEPPKDIKSIKENPAFRAHFFEDYFKESIQFGKEALEKAQPSFVWTDMNYNIKPAIQLVSKNTVIISTHRLRFSQNYEFPEAFDLNLNKYNHVLDLYNLPPIKRIVDLVFGDLMIYPFPSQILLGTGEFAWDELYLNIGHLVPKENIISDTKDAKKGVFITAGTFFRGEQLHTIITRLLSYLSNFKEHIYLAISPEAASKLTLPNNVSLVKFNDYGKVLSKCSLIIHHAGHGTAETALLYGIPQLVYPTGTKGRYNIAFQLEKMGVGKLLDVKSLFSENDVLKTISHLQSKAVQKRCVHVAKLTRNLGGPDYAAKIINKISDGIDVMTEIKAHQAKVMKFNEIK